MVICLHLCTRCRSNMLYSTPGHWIWSTSIDLSIDLLQCYNTFWPYQGSFTVKYIAPTILKVHPLLHKIINGTAILAHCKTVQFGFCKKLGTLFWSLMARLIHQHLFFSDVLLSIFPPLNVVILTLEIKGFTVLCSATNALNLICVCL